MLGAAPACNDSQRYVEPGPIPQIVSVAGPKDGVVRCSPDKSGGACPLPLGVSFRLAEDRFVSKAYVRFQGDGSDVGVDRGYLVTSTWGLGTAQDQTVKVDAVVPATILRVNAQLTYSIRLVTGTGDESTESTLQVTIQEEEEDRE